MYKATGDRRKLSFQHGVVGIVAEFIANPTCPAGHFLAFTLKGFPETFDLLHAVSEISWGHILADLLGNFMLDGFVLH